MVNLTTHMFLTYMITTFEFTCDVLKLGIDTAHILLPNRTQLWSKLVNKDVVANWTTSYKYS